MYCWKCGKKIPEDSLFCEFCGAKQTDFDFSNISGNMDTAETADSAEISGIANIAETADPAQNSDNWNNSSFTNDAFPVTEITEAFPNSETEGEKAQPAEIRSSQSETSGNMYFSAGPSYTADSESFTNPATSVTPTSSYDASSSADPTAPPAPAPVTESTASVTPPAPSSSGSGSISPSAPPAPPSSGSGSASSAAPSAPPRKKNTALIAGIIAGIAVIIGLSVFLYTKLSKTAINLNDYVSVDFEGTDGYGYAYAVFDYDAFYADYGEKDNYDDLSYCFYPYIDQDNYLSNGDTVTVCWDCDEDAAKELGYRIKYENQNFTVSDLPELVEINLNDYLNFTCAGFDGYGIVDMWLDIDQIREDYSDYPDIDEVTGYCMYVTSDIYDDAMNGDTVTTEWYCDDSYANELGFSLIYSDESFSVSGLEKWNSPNQGKDVIMYCDYNTISLYPGDVGTIRFSVEGDLPTRFRISASENSSRYSLDWNGWNHDYSYGSTYEYNDLDIYALQPGSYKMTVEIIDSSSNVIVNSMDVWIVIHHFYEY